MKKIFKRLKSQKGMSGVLVALLLVVVGVGLVAGLNTYLDTRKSDIQTAADASFTSAGVTPTAVP
ncbi:hypothetical protein [Sulfurimonas marina]|uniref:Uncharacterized protein n=1 Tax=Sulfurimonas marina TaxID=2590551 RepID=A0A7M1AXM7_9BACT|nr:hypothetical protein [Sulfurimonas marina]QOP42203.1 hypothetical protein FJR03_10830 [Sulfurimonas marina]